MHEKGNAYCNNLSFTAEVNRQYVNLRKTHKTQIFKYGKVMLAMQQNQKM